MDAWGVALAGEEFGAVEAERFDSDEDLSWFWPGDGHGFDFELFGAPLGCG